MSSVNTTSKRHIGQNVAAIGIGEEARKVSKARPAKPLADVALIAGFVVVLGAIFLSALHATDGESLFWLIVLFGAVGAMFPAEAVWRVVGE